MIFGERFGGSVEDETYVLKTEWPRLSKRRLWAQSQRDHGDRMTGRAKTSVTRRYEMRPGYADQNKTTSLACETTI